MMLVLLGQMGLREALAEPAKSLAVLQPTLRDFPSLGFSIERSPYICTHSTRKIICGR